MSQLLTNTIPVQPISTERFNKFLDSYNFYSNNIDFRIISSKAIEKFKNVQSFQLNQITNGKFYFPKDRKEILLLKYDMWTRWIYEIENLFIELLGNTSCSLILDEHIGHLIRLSNKTHDKYVSVMLKEYSSYFDQEFVKIWLSCHKVAHDIQIKRLGDLKGYQFHIAFPIIVENIIQSMRYTLIELHELNGLYSHFVDEEEFYTNSKRCELPFLVFTDMDKVSYSFNHEHLIVHRLKMYMKHFDIKEIFIKNFSDDQFDKDIFDKIEELGIIINYKMNF